MTKELYQFVRVGVCPQIPPLRASVGIGDPLVIIVKVLSTELCVLCRVAQHLVNLLLRFFMLVYSDLSMT
jgi:hypothetical protein